MANQGERKGKEKERDLVPALVWVFVSGSSRVVDGSRGQHHLLIPRSLAVKASVIKDIIDIIE